MLVGRSTQGREPMTVDIIALADSMIFDQCPICSEPKPTSREHVPPEAIGGSVMTWTCATCNNEFGSRLEPHLIDWWEDATPRVTLTHRGVRGERRVARVLVRQTRAGEPVFVFDRPDRAVGAALGPGSELTMQVTVPDRARSRLAALKTAYLAACLLVKDIPVTPEAAAIRTELLAARDAPRDAPLTESAFCAGLTIWRSHGPSTPGEIALVQTRPSGGAEDGSEPEFAISIAGTLLVSWPIGGFLISAAPDGTLGSAVPLSKVADH
jgi:hypothetical protein